MLSKFCQHQLDLLVCTGQGVAVGSLFVLCQSHFAVFGLVKDPVACLVIEWAVVPSFTISFFRIAWFALVTGKRWGLFLIVFTFLLFLVILIFVVVLVVFVCFLVLQGLQLFVHHCNELLLC